MVFLAMISCEEENHPPTCKITSPAHGAEYNIGARITIYADANDSDGTVKEVHFYVDGTGISVLDSTPYSYTWKTTDALAGNYKLKVTAHDNENAFGSDEIEIALVENSGSNGPCPGMPTVTDIDGNIYNTVLIGDQCWMKENLKVTHYPNGNTIPYITDNDEWGALDDYNTNDAYCYYENNINSEYGALYTYAAAIADNWQRDNANGQGICPDGWHLPSGGEWQVLEGNVDTEYPVGDPEWNLDEWRGYDAGIHLKSTSGWSENGNGDNNSGFTALPGGLRHSYDGEFYYAGGNGYWWSDTEGNGTYSWFRKMQYSNDDVYQRYDSYNSYGYSVRCIMNNM